MITLYLSAIGALSIAGLIYWRWAKGRKAEIDESGDLMWARFAEQNPDMIHGVERARFREIFARVHFPRFPKYALIATSTFIASLPLIFYMLGFVAWSLDGFGLEPDAQRLARSEPVNIYFEAGKTRDGDSIIVYWTRDAMLNGYFLGVLLTWIAIVAVAMRRYHARRPGYLEEELANERAKGAAG